MINILIVGIGGFIGSIARYLLGGWIHRLLNNAWFPYGTLVINICGCFIIGFLNGLSESSGVFSPETRLFIFIGILGGFTTFSSFGYETFALFRDGEWLASIANITLQIILGLCAVWFGNVISR